MQIRDLEAKAIKDDIVAECRERGANPESRRAGAFGYHTLFMGSRIRLRCYSFCRSCFDYPGRSFPPAMGKCLSSYKKVYAVVLILRGDYTQEVSLKSDSNDDYEEEVT